MCLSCGSWPWGSALRVADAPTKDEYIFLGADHSFYRDHRVGFHPPAPVYQAQAPTPTPTMYYYNHNSGNSTSTPYYANGYYYAAPQTPTTGYYCYPSPNSNYSTYTPRPNYNYNCNICDPYPPFPKWNTYSNSYSYSAAQAAAAAAAAAATSTSQQPTYYLGATRAEVDAQNAAIAYNTGATIPAQLAPYKPANGQQFWCKELDGSWTLRTYTDIMMGELSPGHWEMAKTGYHYWVRSNPS